ncbi:serine protease snake-like isoform X2 [Ceratina calcarata]|uniref:Serine protease snake-like isoform X2 n=1 Tax=Ceratina calcarata TaxID=156304 RepID=A0AAJ7JCU0_9HYME|nr:serine protease snake-like isoform X2 [Ceratina calcarata]
MMLLSASILSWITFFLLVKHRTFCTAQYEGDRCTVDGSSGVCTRLENCDSVRNELMRGIIPRETCGYDKFHPIICCPNSSGVVTANLTVASMAKPSLTSDLTRRPVGAKAKAKCEEYSKYVPYVTHFYASLNITDTTALCKDTFQAVVIGGSPARQKEFPYMAAIGYGNLENGTIHWECGGTLISERFVVTAAHCLFNLNWGEATWIRLGVLDLEKTNKTETYEPQDIRIMELIKHPEYKRPSEYHDIAILRLERSATFNDWVRPTCLPYSLPPTGKAAPTPTAMGWGQVEWGGDRSNYLLKVSVSIKDHDECNATFTGGITDDKLRFGIVDDWQLCAGDFGKDTCQGDSGGPLIFENNDYDCMDTLIGVTSLGKFCGGISPGVYTRIYHYVPWIEDIVWPDP